MAAYLAACLIVGASVLAASEPGRVRGTAWPGALERVERPSPAAMRARSAATGKRPTATRSEDGR
jgi:hypothetical protein